MVQWHNTFKLRGEHPDLEFQLSIVYESHISASWDSSRKGNLGGMEANSANIFDSAIEDQFMLEDFDGEHSISLPSPPFNPQIISDSGEFSRGSNFVATGPARQPTWNSGPRPTQHGQRADIRNSQRSAQQKMRPTPNKTAHSSAEKSRSMLGQEMRNVAQRVRTFGGQLLEIEKYRNPSFSKNRILIRLCRCNKALGQLQSEVANLEVRTTRLEGSIAQVLEQIKQVQELNKEMIEGVRVMCDSFNTVMPSSA
jgi:hypothetical protein